MNNPENNSLSTSRRRFLKLLALLTGGIGLELLGRSWLRSLASDNEDLFLPIAQKSSTSPTLPPTPTRNLKTATPTSTSTPTQTVSTGTPYPPPTGSRVVHLYSPNASDWNGSDTRYWEHVNQVAVDQMVAEGLMALTGTSSVNAAWGILLPNYHYGQGIAIKVNFNNRRRCDDTGGKIDAIIHPVNSLVRGLKQAGVLETDIWIYDAIRAIPDYFRLGSQFNGIKYLDDGCANVSGFWSQDSSSYVVFHTLPGITPPPPIKVTDVLLNAAYLINIPIMKKHGGAGVTLSFKNHFGSIDLPGELHRFMSPWESDYRKEYSPLIDLYMNRHILNKTVLTIGDGLFGCWESNNLPPKPWTTFGNKNPKSLFFATDPVAIDCVMTDFLSAETSLNEVADDYLPLAGKAGLGTYERGDPWGSGYKTIDYYKIVL